MTSEGLDFLGIRLLPRNGDLRPATELIDADQHWTAGWVCAAEPLLKASSHAGIVKGLTSRDREIRTPNLLHAWRQHAHPVHPCRQPSSRVLHGRPRPCQLRYFRGVLTNPAIPIPDVAGISSLHLTVGTPLPPTDSLRCAAAVLGFPAGSVHPLIAVPHSPPNLLIGAVRPLCFRALRPPDVVAGGGLIALCSAAKRAGR